MNPNEEEREYVEAVPGPAIVISKQEYERMQKDAKKNAEENAKRLEKICKSITNIDSSEVDSEDDEITL